MNDFFFYISNNKKCHHLEPLYFTYFNICIIFYRINIFLKNVKWTKCNFCYNILSLKTCILYCNEVYILSYFIIYMYILIHICHLVNEK